METLSEIGGNIKVKFTEAMQCGIIEQSFQRYHILKSRNDAWLNRSQLFHRALVFSLEAHHRVLHMGATKKNSKELTTLEEKFNAGQHDISK